jgi:hypothetical protein
MSFCYDWAECLYRPEHGFLPSLSCFSCTRAAQETRTRVRYAVRRKRIRRLRPAHIVRTGRMSKGEEGGHESRCSVCRHPNRTEIEKALAAGVVLRKLASQFAVSKDAARYKEPNGSHDSDWRCVNPDCRHFNSIKRRACSKCRMPGPTNGPVDEEEVAGGGSGAPHRSHSRHARTIRNRPARFNGKSSVAEYTKVATRPGAVAKEDAPI